MSKNKLIIIVVAVIVILAAIGCGSSQSGNQAATQDSTSEANTPTVRVDCGLDSTDITSCSVDDSGVTIEIYDNESNTENLTLYEVSKYEFGGNTVYSKYDSEKDKYVAKGVTLTIDGEESLFGSVELYGGESATLKFSVEEFTKAEDYDGFVIYMNQRFAGTYNGVLKDLALTVHVS